MLERKRRQFLCSVYIMFTLVVSFKVLLSRSTSSSLYPSLWPYINLSPGSDLMLFFHWRISVISIQGQPLCLFAKKHSWVITALVVTRFFFVCFFCRQESFWFMVCFDVCFPYWSCSSNDLLWLQCRSTGELCLVALRLLTVWLLPRSLTLPLSKTLQMPSFSLHLVRGFFPPAHALKVHKEMDEDVILDEDWLRVMLLHFKESISDRDDISLISLCLSWVHLLPRWKNIFNRAPPVWQHYYSWNEALKLTPIY